MTKQNEKLTSKTWFVVLTLIIFFPIGLFFMWRNKMFNMPIRVIVTAFFGIAILANLGSSNSEPVAEPEPVEEVEEEPEEKEESEGETDEEIKEREDKQAEEEQAKKDEEANKLTVSEEQAVGKAKSYISLTAFSHSGLVKQLEFEGFSNEDAEVAVDNIEVDWNEQAGKKAESYLDLTSFSRSGLIDQLKFEGFTDEQAEFGVEEVGL